MTEDLCENVFWQIDEGKELEKNVTQLILLSKNNMRSEISQLIYNEIRKK